MAAVWYIGQSNVRRITAAEWAAAGIAGANDSEWNSANGWSIPQTSFTAGQLTILEADNRFVTGAADGPRTGSSAVALEVVDQSPKELAYAETVTVFTTTVAGLNLGDVNSKVTGLTFNLVGAGRPVEIECFLPKVARTVGSTVRLALVQDNAIILNCNDTQVVANAGEGMICKGRTLPLVKGQTYTFDARLCGDAAGTTTSTHAAGSHKGYLSAVQR